MRRIHLHLFFSIFAVFGSVAFGDHSSPAGSSYLPPTAASTGYGAPGGQPSYGGGNDDYYDDYEEPQASYSEPAQVSIIIFVTFLKSFWPFSEKPQVNDRLKPPMCNNLRDRSQWRHLQTP